MENEAQASRILVADVVG